MQRLNNGVGVCDAGPHPSKINGKATQLYSRWADMLTRCYSKNYQRKRPSYIGCSVDPYFHSFQRFASWSMKQIGWDKQGWDLDKDILIKGNVVYGPDRCAFVPHEVNLIFPRNKGRRGPHPVGVTMVTECGRVYYKAACSSRSVVLHIGNYQSAGDAFYAYKKLKESLIKDAANRFRNELDVRVYRALIEYQIDITD